MNRSSRNSLFKKPILWISLLMPFALILAACAPAATPIPTAMPQPTAMPAPTSTSSASIPATGEASIMVATDPTLGKILVDGKGMTLYIFTKDTPDKSNCTGGCIKSWPALLTQGKPTLGPGVDASLIGSAALPDGSKIVTYNHMPLYYYAKDTKAGDVTGQNVGSVWFVISPDGKPVGMTAPASSAPAASSEASIMVATDPTLGKILVDGKGMALYMFAKDTPDKSNCAGGCLKAWPALLTQGKPTLGAGVDASLVGSTALPDGSKIVTYNHMPLYYYAKDTKVGDVTGQNVGSVWFVVSPDGKAVGMTAPASSAPAASNEASIMVTTDAKLGKILVDGKGMTLYMFTKDAPDKSNCAGGCLKAWPALLTQGKPTLGAGVDASLVGSTALADGSKIVTYNHMPLYYYAKDTKAGDVTGQNVGSVWYVVSPDGKAVTSASGY